MSLKSEIKMGILHEQGVKAEDHLESAHKRQAGHDGAKQALRVVAKNILSLASLADRDRDEGKLPLDEPMHVLAYVKGMIDRAANMALSAAQHQENLQISVSGEITAYKSMVEALDKEIKLEKSKVEAVRNAIASGDIVVESGIASHSDQSDQRGRMTGVRPNSGIAAQRKAEAVVSIAETEKHPTVDQSDAHALDSEEGQQEKKQKRGKRKVE